MAQQSAERALEMIRALLAGTLTVQDVTAVAAAVGATPDVNLDISADVEPAVAAAAGLRLVGFAVRESSAGGAAATINIIHGAAVAGGIVTIPIELVANESVRDWFGPNGIAVDDGLSIEMVDGDADVILFHKTVA